MPKIKCICSNIINLHEIPNGNEWMLISDVDFDGICTGENIGCKELYEKMYEKMDIVVKCDNCSRIFIYKVPYENPIIYKMESKTENSDLI